MLLVTNDYYMDIAYRSFTPKSKGIFIPENFGNQDLPDLNRTTTSPLQAAQHLGYNEEQVHLYFGDFDDRNPVKRLLVEVFSKNVIVVFTDERLPMLTAAQVNYFMRDFNLEEQFDSVTTEDILERGVSNQSLTIDFLARVLKIADPTPGGIFFVDSIGYTLYFSEGVLRDFRSSNGLSVWAKKLNQLNAGLVARHEKEARQYWGNNSGKVLSEVNRQAEAFADVPHDVDNEFTHLHRTPFETVNYAMLLVCHYERSITLSEFKDINHGRYQVRSGPGENLHVFTLGAFTYEFLPMGSLFRVIQT